MRIPRVMLLFILYLFSGAVAGAQTKHYDFKVFLDEKAIGHHRFVVAPNDAYTRVTSEADFNVKFLFISVYTYQHSNSEIWQGDCLRTIDSTTDVNGEASFVRGQHNDQHLLVKTPEGAQRLDGCIRTFAYWDLDLLTSEQLLNAQTGELEPVDLRSLGKSTILVRGEQVIANQYRIINDKISIDLWYSNSRVWLALESTTENGARLRYLTQ